MFLPVSESASSRASYQVTLMLRGLLKNGAVATFLGPSLTDVGEKQKGIKRP